MPQGKNVAAFENEAASDASHNDKRADNLNHGWPLTPEVMSLGCAHSLAPVGSCIGAFPAAFTVRQSGRMMAARSAQGSDGTLRA
jgi:hypothetical protein